MNLCAEGKSLAEAYAIVNAPKNTGEAAAVNDGEPKKLSASDKKAALIPQFKALGLELPAEGDSLAKWEQALTAAATTEDAEEDIM